MIIYILVRNVNNILLNDNKILNFDHLDDTMFSKQEVAKILAKREEIRKTRLFIT